MAITRIGPNQSINLASNITGTLPTGNGGTGATSFAPGKVLQVINSVSSTEVVVSNNTPVDSGLTATITPSSSSNKILVFANCTGIGKGTNNTWAEIKLVRDSTNIVQDFEARGGSTGDTSANKIGGVSVNFLDSPSTTSATTYKVMLRSGNNSSYAQFGNSNSKSTMTLMEIAT